MRANWNDKFTDILIPYFLKTMAADLDFCNIQKTPVIPLIFDEF